MGVLTPRVSSEASATARVGENVFVDLKAFQASGAVITNPSYEFVCYPLQREGEIDAYR